jgi:hypothetical protein
MVLKNQCYLVTALQICLEYAMTKFQERGKVEIEGYTSFWFMPISGIAAKTKVAPDRNYEL